MIQLYLKIINLIKEIEQEVNNRGIDLASVIRTEHKVKTEIAPFVIGALCSVSKRLETYIDVIGIPNLIVPPL